MEHEHLTEMKRLASLLDEALSYTKDKAKEYAEKERDYRKAKAKAWAADEGGGLADERRARVDAAVADDRYERDLADSMRRLGFEAIQSRRAQISAMQTYLKAETAEAEFARTGPR